MDNALDFIAPVAKTVQLRGGLVVQVAPIRVKQLAPLARACEPAMTSIALLGSAPPPADMLDLLAQHGEALVEAVSICTALPQVQLDELLPDELAALALACVEVNADFFGQALAQLVLATPSLAPNLAAKLGVGAAAAPAPAGTTQAPSTS